MANSIFTQSEHIHKEYACEVVRIGRVEQIEGSDFLAKTEIHPGMPIVVRKDEVKSGDVMFYVDMECQLNDSFLRKNNQYQDTSLNDDNTKSGFFNKNGRVRMVKLRGQESMGYLFDVAAMKKYINAEFDINKLVGTVFDTVNGELFVQAYVPKKPESSPTTPKNRRDKKLKRFDRMIPGEFSFHYDTQQLEKSIQKINPDDVIDISIKMHGTSCIFSNCKVLRKLSLWEKFKKLVHLPVQLTEYDHIYSSRTVIKNQYINESVTPGYYKEDIWGHWNGLIKDFIERDYTVYGEIVGYTPSGTPIQKAGNVFDYGCKPGESKLMIYRITKHTDNGIEELDVQDVIKYTKELKDLIYRHYSGIADNIIEIPVVYHGTLKELYPEIPVDDNWYANIVHALANEKKFFMEMDEPMCKNKVPREGLVLRIQGDPIKEAFKLKTMRFRNKEAKAIDEGSTDIEMEQAY